MAWGSLGDMVFTLLGGPFSFQDKQEADFAELGLLGSKPRLQFVGPKLEEITLQIRLHALTTPTIELDLRSLRDTLTQGDVVDLVIGQEQTGIYAGKFVITSLEHERLEQWPNGRLRMAEATVKLKEWTPAPGLVTSARKNPAGIRKKGQSSAAAVQSKTVQNKDGVALTKVGVQ